MRTIKKAIDFCHSIFDLDNAYSKVLVNLVMSLASNQTSRSIVGLSENPLFEHHYSSISQAIKTFGSKYSKVGFEQVMQKLYMSFFPKQDSYLLVTDGSPLERPFSPCLSEQQYVKVPNNVVPSNKSLSIGYNYSYVNVGYAPEVSQGGARWSLPLSVNRIKVQSDAIETALVQLKSLMENADLPFKLSKLVRHASDNGYTTPRFLSPLVGAYDNMVLNTRFRNSQKVWKQVQNTTNIDKNDKQSLKGAKSVYSKETYYLIGASDSKTTTNGKTKESTTKQRTSIYDITPDETYEFLGETSRKKRKIISKISVWNNMMIRTKAGHNMKDKPFTLIAVQVIDAQTGELVFQRPMFTGIFGKKRDQISAELAVKDYRERYDIEPHNRFGKQQLLLDKYQTPDVAHLDNWTLIVACAYWLLFVASDEVKTIVKPWEKYLSIHKEQKQAEQSKQQTPKKSIAQVKKAALSLFYTFNRKPFSPKSVNNGKGRKKGNKQKPRTKHRVLRKSDFTNKTRKNE